MSYRNPLFGLGALPAGQTLPIGTRLAAGYSVTGMTIPAAQAPAQLQQAMQAGFRGRTIRTGWGGGGDSAGVPAGNLFAEVEVAADGITSDTMNTVFQRVGQALASRVGGTVRNTYAHVTRGASGGATGGGGKTGVSFLDQMLPADPGAPTDAYYSPTPGSTNADSGFPVWAIAIGGAAIIGVGLIAIATKKPRPAAVAANRRRRRRR